MKFPGENSEGKDRLKLKAGDSIRGIFTGDPYIFRTHWIGSSSALCSGTDCPHCTEGNKSAFRFKINFIVKENEVYVAKFFEQGFGAYQTLKTLHEGDYNLEKHVMKITRTGSTKTDTRYTIIPVPNGQINNELAETLKQVKLINFTTDSHETHAPEALPEREWETPTDSDKIPWSGSDRIPEGGLPF